MNFRLRNWFFTKTSTAVKKGTRYQDGDKPPQETFEDHLYSSVMRSEEEDKAKPDSGEFDPSLVGHVLLATDEQAKTKAAQPAYGSIVVTPENLTEVVPAPEETIDDFTGVVMDTTDDATETKRSKPQLTLTSAFKAWMLSRLIPSGGNTNDVLSKTSNDDYVFTWNPPSGGISDGSGTTWDAVGGAVDWLGPLTKNAVINTAGFEFILENTATDELLHVENSGVIAIGKGAENLGTSSTIVYGENAYADTALTIVIGANSILGGASTIAIGNGITTNEDFGIAIGGGSSLGGEDSLAIGYQANAGGLETMAIGNNSVATGSFGMAIGKDATTGAHQATLAIGYNASVTSQGGTAVGASATASNGGVAFGSGANGGNTGVAVGSQARVGTSSIRIGYQFYNTLSGNDSISIGTNRTAGVRSIVIGNNSGADPVVKSDVLIIGTNANSARLGTNSWDGSVLQFKSSALADGGDNNASILAQRNPTLNSFSIGGASDVPTMMIKGGDNLTQGTYGGVLIGGGTYTMGSHLNHGGSVDLELGSGSKAFLPNRVASTAAITTPITGMIVFDLSAGVDGLPKCYYNGTWNVL